MPRGTPLAGPHNLDYFKYRALEWLPGLLSWGTLVACVVLSFTAPLAAAYVIVLYDFYWLIRITYLLCYIISSWRRYRRAIRVDWLAKLDREVPHWRRFRHAIILPTYREPYEVVRASFLKLVASAFDLKQVTVVLAGEGRDEEAFRSVADRISSEFGEHFDALLVTVHPANLPGEMPGKGSNTHYAGKQLKEYVDSRGWAYEDVVVSAFDVDTWVHPQYLAALTHRYATHPDPTHVSYQPLTIYHNNVWTSDVLTRAVSSSTTFWLLTDLARSERLFTFSSHSMPFKALVDVGFWEPDVVSEDSRIFLQCLLRYDGHYQVEPIYVPVSMSTANMGKFWRSLRNQYLQMRRWAWGVENLPYMLWQFARGRGRNVLPSVKFRHAFNYLEGNFTWATAPLIITVLGRLPFTVAPQEIGRAHV